MATQSSDRRSQVMLGDLPENFLRLDISNGSMTSTANQQVLADHQTAQMLQAQQQGFSFASPSMARMNVTVTQAKLAKNYGLTKMDPYCRLRLGHSVFETPTAHNGSKNPRWNKTLSCFVPHGVETMYMELFDERAFTMDERIAWAHITIPPRVFNGETVDDWYPLSGKQGDDKEGMINIVLSYTKGAGVVQPQPLVYAQQPVMVVPGSAPLVYHQPVGTVPAAAVARQPARSQGPLYTEEDVKQVKDMFPAVDEEVIKSLLEANRGNKDVTINNLLSMDSS